MVIVLAGAKQEQKQDGSKLPKAGPGHGCTRVGTVHMWTQCGPWLYTCGRSVVRHSGVRPGYYPAWLLSSLAALNGLHHAVTDHDSCGCQAFSHTFFVIIYFVYIYTVCA